MALEVAIKTFFFQLMNSAHQSYGFYDIAYC